MRQIDEVIRKMAKDTHNIKPWMILCYENQPSSTSSSAIQIAQYYNKMRFKSHFMRFLLDVLFHAHSYDHINPFFSACSINLNGT